jgi:hypothetical protein
MPKAPIQRTRRGDYRVRLGEKERDLLRGLPSLVRALLSDDDRDDPALRRLFPSAFMDDAVLTEEFDRMVRDDLLRQRLNALETMEATIDEERLSQAQMEAWLAAINDVRLILGVRLAVSEESTSEDFAEDEGTQGAFAVYLFLGFLEEHIVTALVEAV